MEAEDDEGHERAVLLRDELRKGTHGSLVTSSFVLDETVTLLKMRKGTLPALGFLEKTCGSKSLHMVWIDQALFQQAEGILKESRERKWSFTDCTSFALMRELGVKEAFAFDRNFEEAGFTRLP